MTVPGETSPVPVNATESADQLFTRIYERNRDRLVRHIYFRLDLRHADLAEDLAQEVFIKFWSGFVQNGRLTDPDNERMVYGLLKKMAQGPIGDFYELCSTQRDRSLDLNDPVNTPVVATGHAYAAEVPELSLLADELDSAMDHMTACSEKWRSLHKERYTLRGYLAPGYLASRGGLTAEAKARFSDRLKAADAEEPDALAAFRNSCREVGRLRAEIEAQAGVNWRSATGMPTAPEIVPFLKGRYRNDRSVTHCPDGHLLDKDNTHFGLDGARRCRACNTATTVKAKAKTRRPAGRSVPGTVDAEAIVRARAIIADPAQAHLSLQKIGESIGCSASTLANRIPDHKELRRSALAGAAR